jgi:hypothetical protein
MDDLLIHIKKNSLITRPNSFPKFEMTKIKHLKFLEGFREYIGKAVVVLLSGITCNLKYSYVRAPIKYQV